MTVGFGPRAPGALDSIEGNAPRRTKPRPRRLGSIVWWIVFLLGFLYFFVPLFATLIFSLKRPPFGDAFVTTVTDSELLGALGYSFVVAILTVIGSVALIVPTAYWVRLRLPRLRPYVEFVTLLPFVVPPVILVFGLLNTYSHPPVFLTQTNIGNDVLMVCAYIVLSFPYMYRAVDTGLRSIDIRTLTEASQSLGASWPRIMWSVILPNLRVAILAGAFLTVAIVVGEFTIATFLGRQTFAPFLSILGDHDPYEQAAVTLVSFGITWIAMGLIGFIGRGSRDRIQVAGAH
ncbi:MAG TPA: ABC transporter permease subunit [Candidatus Dormibacteraeota bacterium]|nr:ABC transporter permease subunit [Candidatus Dormibacteraeota bacterium]